MKSLTQVIVGILVGAAGLYLTLHWPEEKLHFSLSEPAKFGEVTYQSLEIINDGWNPAENIVVKLENPSVTTNDVRSSSPFNFAASGSDVLATTSRIRRSEEVKLTFAFRGTALTPRQVSVKSDRSLAAFIPKKEGWRFDGKSFWLGVLAFFVAIMVLGGGIPSFVKARQTSQKNACFNNLTQIDIAKAEAGILNKLKNGDVISEPEISHFIKGGISSLKCPAGGKYFVNPAGTDAECSKHGIPPIETRSKIELPNQSV